MQANPVACRHRLAETLLFVFPYQQIEFLRLQSLQGLLDVATIAAVVWLNAPLSFSTILLQEYAHRRGL
ncbi:hypothetical protein CQ14_34275 [Bradyrhizobium lablabi]|uniref:Uncharacterized protein n=1 Tax=Bradyrhizobium lablabi TaxID=722472 RepID=A0A0R3N4A7_9BRAD|nr:hypothetical protein CQ14_34275 [Bradyrhizobium lablabi]